jgi:hypothetical protein
MNSFSYQSNSLNYQSACTWGIYSLLTADEMLRYHRAMEKEEYLEGIHLRIERVTEDLRVIQRELNCAAMQAPNDPELMEALSALPETEPIQVLRSALDQMRHFLWFYTQVMNNESEVGDKLRQTIQTRPASDEKLKLKTSFLDRLSRSDEATLVRYLAEAKERKPN